MDKALDESSLVNKERRVERCWGRWVGHTGERDGGGEGGSVREGRRKMRWGEKRDKEGDEGMTG
jgi:hypothetical protein